MTALGDALKATLRATLREVAEDKILTPITRSVLLDPKFAGFEVPVRAWTPRPYDGWFHPSTHATWTARQLYFYLADPERLEVERMGLTSVIAITQGHFFHEFLQRLWLAHGILQRAECPLVDKECNRKGHMDGLLTNFEGLEIKTMNDFKLPKIFDAASLRELKPEYYAQTQDYLAMSGLSAMRYFIISTAYPYHMQEFSVPFDDPFQQAQREKCLTALRAFEEGRPPAVCCAPRSATAKACPVRGACEIGRVN